MDAEFVSDSRGAGYLPVEMPIRSDAQLLRDYPDQGVETPFTELVRRHTDLVCSAAIRQVSFGEAAAEISRSVFLGLSRGAEALAARLLTEASMAGWLCHCTRNQSVNFRREKYRRQSREKQSMVSAHAVHAAPPAPERVPGARRHGSASSPETNTAARVPDPSIPSSNGGDKPGFPRRDEARIIEQKTSLLGMGPPMNQGLIRIGRFFRVTYLRKSRHTGGSFKAWRTSPGFE